jgi:mono/diheme cytochrome c family protein
VNRSRAKRNGLAAVLAGLAVPALSPAIPPAELTPVPQANYMLNCMGCHIADGSGAAGKVPSVRDSLLPLASNPAGRRYLVQVPGSAESRLSNVELAQVLNWMARNLSAQPLPAGFVEFTAQEVERYRKTPLVDVSAARARLLGATARLAPSSPEP